MGCTAVTPAATSAVPARAQRVRVRPEEVDVAHAVDLQVDESRHGEPAPAAPAGADRVHDAARDLDVAGQQPAVDERGGDAEPHPAPQARGSASRCSASSRAAASGVTPSPELS